MKKGLFENRENGGVSTRRTGGLRWPFPPPGTYHILKRKECMDHDTRTGKRAGKEADRREHDRREGPGPCWTPITASSPAGSWTLSPEAWRAVPPGGIPSTAGAVSGTAWPRASPRRRKSTGNSTRAAPRLKSSSPRSRSPNGWPIPAPRTWRNGGFKRP